MARPTVRAVFFDVGETLADETAAWGDWADWMGIPSLTFFAAPGGIIERGLDHRAVFGLLRPGFDLERERAAKEAAGRGWRVRAGNLYPDVLPCLQTLRGEGYLLGVAGNQSIGESAPVGALGLPVDVIASSEEWGTPKPSPGFFARLAEAAGLPPSRIAYVGDRVDNDVLPAGARLRIESLAELPGALRALPGG